MLRSYCRENSHLVLAEEGIPSEGAALLGQAQFGPAVWIDLYNPAPG